jgi:hypothetical protein
VVARGISDAEAVVRTGICMRRVLGRHWR